MSAFLIWLIFKMPWKIDILKSPVDTRQKSVEKILVANFKSRGVFARVKTDIFFFAEIFVDEELDVPLRVIDKSKNTNGSWCNLQ